ncbi:MAG: hypothetical protein WCK90_02445 [archaeon]
MVWTGSDDLEDIAQKVHERLSDELEKLDEKLKAKLIKRGDYNLRAYALGNQIVAIGKLAILAGFVPDPGFDFEIDQLEANLEETRQEMLDDFRRRKIVYKYLPSKKGTKNKKYG